MLLTRLLNLWPPFDTTRMTPQPSHYHVLIGVPTEDRELFGPESEYREVHGQTITYHRVRMSQ